MIIAVPALTPVTRPEAFTVAFRVLLLVHTPPPVASLSPSVADWHTGALPVIAAGAVFTVTTVVVLQPPLIVYVMVVVPADTDTTLPEKLIVATEVLLLVHETPPGVASVRKVDPPMQISVDPDIGAGEVFTLIL